MLIKTLPFSKQELATLFQVLQAQPGTMFLDSASAEHNDSVKSVFAWQPIFTLESNLIETRIYQGQTLIEISSNDPFKLIEQYLQKANLSEHSSHFSGGAIGYWDYELGGRFEQLPTAKSSEIDLPNMYVGIFDTVIEIDQTTNEARIISQNKEAQTQFDAIKKLIKTETNIAAPFELTSDWVANMTRQEYSEKFHKVQDYLLSGDCYQINLAQRFKAQYQGSEWQAYQTLRRHNKAPFSAFIRHHKGAVLSVSPERFVQVNGTNIETKPIKGTRPRSLSPQQDIQLANELQNADKDRAENLMIVDLLRNDLSKVAVPGSVDVPKLFAIESFPAVHHLVSTVTAQLAANFSSLDLLRGAFPGGSITGAPKIRAMEIIHELEPHPRSVYCGAIGYIKGNGDMDTNISIRTLVCCQNSIYCWAGGGLVADSNVDDEYQETLDKLNKILPVLQAKNPIEMESI